MPPPDAVPALVAEALKYTTPNRVDCDGAEWYTVTPVEFVHTLAAALTEAAARVAAQDALLARLLTNPQLGLVEFGDGGWGCAYCRHRWDADQLDHAAGCVVTEALAQRVAGAAPAGEGE